MVSVNITNVSYGLYDYVISAVNGTTYKLYNAKSGKKVAVSDDLAALINKWQEDTGGYSSLFVNKGEYNVKSTAYKKTPESLLL